MHLLTEQWGDQVAKYFPKDLDILMSGIWANHLSIQPNQTQSWPLSLQNFEITGMFESQLDAITIP